MLSASEGLALQFAFAKTLTVTEAQSKLPLPQLSFLGSF